MLAGGLPEALDQDAKHLALLPDLCPLNLALAQKLFGFKR